MSHTPFPPLTLAELADCTYFETGYDDAVINWSAFKIDSLELELPKPTVQKESVRATRILSSR